MGYWDQVMTEEQCAAAHVAGVPTSMTHPWEGWIVSLDVHSVGVTELELAQLRSFAEYEVRRAYYGAWAQRILLAAPFRCDGHNTVVFARRADGGWSYRRASWEIGPMYVPTWDDPPIPILAVMDRIAGERADGDWEEWKAGHHDLFGAVETQT